MPQASLQIFIIGGRLGESIVIRTPAGAFGVVDAYASDWTDPDQNPSLTRLTSLRAEKLKFIVMTHPHMDHYRGLPAIFAAYSGHIESFWRAPWGGVDLLCKAFLREFNEEKNDSRREFLVEGYKVLRSLLDRAAGETEYGEMDNFTLQNDSTARYDGILLEEPEHDFSIICLGPSTNIANPYSDKIAPRVISLAPGDQKSTWKPPHNEISTVLAIKYGSWVGILGGDTEQDSWNDILERRSNLLGATRFFKISHHGSPTGSFAELWDSIKSDACEAAVTCFSRQGLPNEDGLRFLRERNFPLHSTNKVLAEGLYRGTGSAPMPIAFKVNNKAGEIKVEVEPEGEMKIEYLDPAGLMQL